MTSAKTPPVTGEHSLKHIQGSRVPHLAHDNPVRPHAKARADEVANADLQITFRVGISRFQPHQVLGSRKVQLRVILDGDDALASRDLHRQSV